MTFDISEQLDSVLFISLQILNKAFKQNACSSKPGIYVRLSVTITKLVFLCLRIVLPTCMDCMAGIGLSKPDSND